MAILPTYCFCIAYNCYELGKTEEGSRGVRLLSSRPKAKPSMDLRFAFLANSAEVGPDGRFFVLGGGIEGIGVGAVPMVCPALAVLCRIHFLREECGREYRIRLTMTYPDGTASDLASEIVTTPYAIVHGYEDRGGNLQVAFNVFGMRIPQEGEYSFHFGVDDIHVGDQSFFVRVLPGERAGGA